MSRARRHRPEPASRQLRFAARNDRGNLLGCFQHNDAGNSRPQSQADALGRGSVTPESRQLQRRRCKREAAAFDLEQAA
jgi:hypothetical protein